MQLEKFSPERRCLLQHRSRDRQAKIEQTRFIAQLLNRNSMNDDAVRLCYDARFSMRGASQGNDMNLLPKFRQTMRQMVHERADAAPAGVWRIFPGQQTDSHAAHFSDRRNVLFEMPFIGS